ncbi:6-phosphogluconolactonase [Corynebacterium sp. H78]|uniref:6-phosphogluconolactonase n=1 Tax=Corynebacterium sp. H78 TaxID=3133417 RepID=UPI0030AD362E
MTASANAHDVHFSRHDDLNDLVEAARDAFASTVVAAQHDGAVARVVLTGGGAGIALLEALRRNSAPSTQPDEAIDWSRVLVFFGDERFVAADDSERNEGQAREALLDHIDIPAGNIFGYLADDGTATPEEAARAYEELVVTHAPEGFDLHLLGMGGEGHINSLFPHTDEIREESQLVVAVHNCPKPPPTRVSLTMPAIAKADRVWLLVSGGAKAEAVRAISDGAAAVDWPAAGVRGRTETVVFVDEAAAALL